MNDNVDDQANRMNIEEANEIAGVLMREIINVVVEVRIYIYTYMNSFNDTVWNQSSI